MDEVTRGLGSDYGEAVFDPLSPWWRPAVRQDRRLHPSRGNPPEGEGRRMTHPLLTDIVYSRRPDRDVNFFHDVLPRADAVLTQTLDGAAVTRFDGALDGTPITEVWLAETLSTHTDMWRQFYDYWVTPLPPGEYVGWQPRDKTPKRFAIEILRVDCGPSEGEYLIESIGKEPGMMRFQLSVTFRCVREVASPSGLVVAVGA